MTSDAIGVRPGCPNPSAIVSRGPDALLDNLTEAVFMTDDRGRFMYLNQAWESLSGWPAREALGMFCGATIAEEDRRMYRREWLALLRGNAQVQRCQVRLRRRDGSDRWVQVSARRAACPNSPRVVLVGTIVDISPLKAAEVALRQAKLDAEAANRATSEFLAAMSHELRTPLNAVIGLSESLADEQTSSDAARVRRYADLIHGAGQHLFREINDILDLARIEAGRIKVAAAPVDVGALCLATQAGLRAEAQLKQLHLVCHRPEPPLVIFADERLLSQAVHNLLVNAIKFTPAGGQVTVDVTSRGNFAFIRISDTGIGIAPEQLQRLFRPFTQLDASLTRRFGGTGLGLVLADRFVRMHGGRIEVASRVEHGSTFTLELPIRSTAGQFAGRDDPATTS